MANWYKIPLTMRTTEREYRANVNGINIVFGAVLGFVLAGAEGLPAYDFAVLLFMSAAIVVTIMYLGQTEYKLFYGVTAAALIALFPIAIDGVIDLTSVPKLQPTLAVWAGMIILVELMPRVRPDKKRTDPEEEQET
ncbi:hypothetical protein [Alteriqipengyuania lutimaris]|uniref:SPW repeat-containing protein n=1 Tax=Alteriqipengyuania lutimaris TaxID=1538146 RepID=A0A395LSV6_9SPHN|nr:hypothetical protein [Alteriqipengyuania lutimaris]MBB3033337.1 hypothetical protein [Alteriqipengyuania lutimaris]RDS77630.1 hypothetical protein DL238_08465 [Alteriqipengyuania lutimaris]